jgi:hypothetical protein
LDVFSASWVSLFIEKFIPNDEGKQSLNDIIQYSYEMLWIQSKNTPIILELVCGTKQLKQPTTMMDIQAIKISTKAKTNMKINKEHKNIVYPVRC